MALARRYLIFVGLLAMLCGVAACGQTSGPTTGGANGGPRANATATPTVMTAEATATTADVGPTVTTDSNAPCQPDPYGIYAQQTGYITTIDVAGLPAPAQTKHGIGSTGVANGMASGGMSGLCTIGSAASITAFYTAQLPALRWSHGTPPAALTTACTANGNTFWSGAQWWKDKTLFAWTIEGPASAGATFWGYSDCALVS